MVGEGPEECVPVDAKKGDTQDGREWSVTARVPKNPS